MSAPPGGGGPIDGARIEEAGLNALQTSRQLFHDGWVLRLSPGKAKRARCVNACFGSSLPLDAKLDHCAAVYAAHGLPLLFRITPFDHPRGLDAALADRGYRAFESSLVLARRLDAPAASVVEPRVDSPGGGLFEVAAGRFADAAAELRGSSAREREAHRERLAQSPLRALFLEWRNGKRSLGVAQATLDGDHVGIFDVVTAEAARRQGIATAACRRLLAWAAGQGARVAYLQVSANNAAALAVYERLGFAVTYRYHYREPDGATGGCVPAGIADRSGGDFASSDLAAALGSALVARGWKLATAESCTGGMIAGAVTAVPGSSAWFDRGFVTYSNAAKIEDLGVPAETIARHGAVSEDTAAAMAAGALARSRADLAVAVTGIAGPDGGTPDKPVGTVCFGWAARNRHVETLTRHFDGDRAAVRAATVIAAFRGLLDRSK